VAHCEGVWVSRTSGALTPLEVVVAGQMVEEGAYPWEEAVNPQEVGASLLGVEGAFGLMEVGA